MRTKEGISLGTWGQPGLAHYKGGRGGTAQKARLGSTQGRVSQLHISVVAALPLAHLHVLLLP